MKKAYWLSLMLALLALAIFPSGALALPFGEAAYATYSTGGVTTAYGTYSNNFVMDNPLLQPGGKHVNSIYVRYDSNNIIELGWSRSYPSGSTNPQGFTVRSKNGSYELVNLGAMVQGQYATFKIDNVAGTTSFGTYINGTSMYTWTSSGFSSGRTRVGSERVNGGTSGDSNYANFKELKYKASNGAWGYWYKANDEYLGGQEDVFYDVYPNDANHSLYIDKNYL